jgi:hypothetical protein
VTTRARIAAFGSAAALLLAGAGCAVVIGDGLGQILAFVLIGIGLVAATSLAFLEVGLSEDRERERERRRASRMPARRRAPKLPRSRGHRRRLG